MEFFSDQASGNYWFIIALRSTRLPCCSRLVNASALVHRDGEIEGLKKDIRELKNRIDSILPPSTV